VLLQINIDGHNCTWMQSADFLPRHGYVGELHM
jgi:hypothetical protein